MKTKYLILIATEDETVYSENHFFDADKEAWGFAYRESRNYLDAIEVNVRRAK
jgi:hypothetical protein